MWKFDFGFLVDERTNSSACSAMFRTVRIDAARHRAAPLRAAADVFLNIGMHAPLDLVSKRAGVGKATLYRHFADRQALVLAMVDETLDRIESVIAEFPGGIELRELFELLVQDLVRNPALADAWRVVDARSPASIGRERRFLSLLDRPIATGIADGTLRADLRSDDGLTMLWMLGAIGRKSTRSERADAAARMMTLVFDGLCA